MDYESMLQQLELTSLSQRRKFLKLTTMYNIINGTLYFPTGYFVQNYFPYSSSHGILIILDHLLVLFVFIICPICSLWNKLHDSVNTSSISVFKAHQQALLFMKKKFKACTWRNNILNIKTEWFHTIYGCLITFKSCETATVLARCPACITCTAGS